MKHKKTFKCKVCGNEFPKRQQCTYLDVKGICQRCFKRLKFIGQKPSNLNITEEQSKKPSWLYELIKKYGVRKKE
jgi:hypothetical protein